MDIKFKKRIMMIALSVLLLTSCERCGKPASPTAAEPQYRPIREIAADMEINPVFGAEPSEEQDAREEPFPEGLLYEIVGGKTITITRYNGSEVRVAIPALIEGLPVTIIGEHAFSGNDLTSVIIPPSVTSIGNEAFIDCYYLTSVTIPPSVTTIGYEAFSGCRSLTSVTIPPSVTSIGYRAFCYCTGMTDIFVEPQNSAYMSENGVLFDKAGKTLVCCPAGKTGAYTIPSSVTSIGNNAFSYCDSLTSVTIPSSVTSIGYRAFSNCYDLTHITIPSSVSYIGEWAFFLCYNLTSVDIRSSVPATIDKMAFRECKSLTSITFPPSVTSIGDAVFHDCASLTNILVDSRNNAYMSMNGVLFDKAGKILVCYPAGKTGAYTIPSSVTTIKNLAFISCSGLTSVTIPSSVTAIGQGAFIDCTGLTNVTIPSSVTSIGDNAFYNCSGLTNVTLSRLTQVGNDAFPDNVRIQYIELIQ